ncbi:bifunctional riboflavin kinase/FAD synthetase [Larkinella terrae]|uniref:Riboflavin biosynthesis protein n=1 Tax=Larkinella terrae TaxID=2025311 RepID=A0A7K0EUB4_9BACT|nr:bifunctional riboflavin kinase/FAD synthetase [Larkinella terrae]MRS65400.1 bifunctional riboflavin kinase/FAD synthetase [Larkinella terrae]
MKIYHGTDTFQSIPYAVVTSGTFDGVHLGHQKILTRLTEIARRGDASNAGGETVVLTFWPHPRTVVSNDSQDLKLLSTLEEKTELLAAAGVDNLVVIPFTRSFSELSSAEFIQQILVDKIGTKKLVIGYDHHFGRNREGSFDYLQQHAHEYGFEIEEIPRQDVEDVGVSSSKIRTALLEGDLKTATKFLGRPYSLSGTIVKGQQLGRTIGFPTANIQVDDPVKLVPSNGIYATEVIYKGQKLGGAMSIGTRPTVGGTHRTIEVYIFDFNQEIYGEHLTVRFIEYLRPELKFEGLATLVDQMQLDVERCREILKM